MIAAYKEHSQFILILAILYVIGVWAGPVIYILYPLFLFLFGLRFRYFELFIIGVWTLMLADYVPVENATHDDLQFAKDLKNLVPLSLFAFFVRDRISFQPYSKLILYFIPFLAIATLGLTDSINLTVGMQKTVSYILMMLVVPMYVNKLNLDDGEYFWKALITFLIGMLSIGLVLRFAAPDIAMLKGGRYKGVLGNPNGLGVFLNLIFILWIVVKEMRLATFTKKENVYIFLVIVISLVWSGSRNGMMSIVLFYVVHRIVKINWFLAVIAILIFVFFNDQIFDVLLTIIEFFGLEDYFRVDTIEEGSGRKIAWVFAWSEIQNYYFIGGGFGHDEHIMRPNYYWLSKKGHEGGVHNSYFSMWFDSGILGVISYFGALIVIMFRQMKFNYIVIAFVVSLCFNVTYESWLVASLNPFTIIYLTILTIIIANFAPNVEVEHVNETDSNSNEESK
ncbi:MAG: O-antigen ligase family protein [Crocinitomicaceae bacterium]